jgi:drug/metabolite transporter superfamily protein YnfA
LIPVVLVAFGADYLAPRNLIGGMLALTALLAVLCATPRAGRIGAALSALAVVALLTITIDVDLSPRLQRGDWRGLARILRSGDGARAITTVQLGSAPLEYYLRGLHLHNLARGASVLVREIDETGYAPLRARAGRPPAPGFRLLARADVNGLILYRFVSPVARSVPEATLRRGVITLARADVLVPFGVAHAR